MFGEMAKWIEEIDSADRAASSSAAPSMRRPPAAPARWSCRCPRTCCARRRPSPIPGPGCRSRPIPASPRWPNCRRCCGGRNGPWSLPAARAGRKRRSPPQRFAERFELPVGCSWRRQGLFDNAHPNYAGDIGVGVNPALAARVKEADLILLIGGRMSEMPSSGYTLIDIPEPARRWSTFIPAPRSSAASTGRRWPSMPARSPLPRRWKGCSRRTRSRGRGSAEAANADYRAWSTPVNNPGPVQLSQIVAWLGERLPEDAVIASAAGNYSVWVHRFYRHRRTGSQLAPTSGSMGYGLPAGLAAKLKYPRAHGGRLCRRRRFPDDHAGIRHRGSGGRQRHRDRRQQRYPRHHPDAPGAAYPGRPVATDIRNPDFAAFARACGGHGETVGRTEDFAAAFERCVASGKPAIIDLAFDPEAITPSRTLSEIRGTGRSR